MKASGAKTLYAAIVQPMGENPVCFRVAGTAGGLKEAPQRMGHSDFAILGETKALAAIQSSARGYLLFAGKRALVEEAVGNSYAVAWRDFTWFEFVGASEGRSGASESRDCFRSIWMVSMIQRIEARLVTLAGSRGGWQ